MIQSMKNGKHTTSSQLRPGILHKNLGVRREEKLFLQPNSWSVYTLKREFVSDAGYFHLHWCCYESYFCIYFNLGNLPGFFSNSLKLKSGNAKLWHMFKRIAHTKACIEFYLCPQMHTALAIVFNSTWWFSFHFLWQNFALCVLLASRFNSPLHWLEWNHLQISQMSSFPRPEAVPWLTRC